MHTHISAAAALQYMQTSDIPAQTHTHYGKLILFYFILFVCEIYLFYEYLSSK